MRPSANDYEAPWYDAGGNKKMPDVGVYTDHAPPDSNLRGLVVGKL